MSLQSWSGKLLLYMLEKQDVPDMEHIVDTEGEDFDHRILVIIKEGFMG